MNDYSDRLRKSNIFRQTYILRPCNYGKVITDNLPTVKVNSHDLDLYTEIEPLKELIPLMHKVFLTLIVEFPKWLKRGKFIKYGCGVFFQIARMKFDQVLKMINKRKSIASDRESLSQLKNDIKEYAQDMGFICGFTKVDRRFIAKGGDAFFPYNNAVVLGMEMSKELLDEVPRPGKRLFDFEIYIKAGFLVFKVAKFIKEKGFKCHIRIPFDGHVKYPPHAIMAGLGELGAQGVVITREYGPRVRWCMISIDAEIEPDSPVNLNMNEYCDACRLCIRSCPGKAISDERLWWRGVYKRKINDSRCYPYFRKYAGCGICIKVCPICQYGYDECMKAYREDGVILRKRICNGES